MPKHKKTESKNHGTVETPAFMPVGTYGAVKGLTPEDATITGTLGPLHKGSP